MDISVVIPVYNQREALVHTLEGFAGQIGAGGRHEVIVVDDGSTDGVASLRRRWSDRLALEWVTLPRSGRAVARNAGIRRASRELIVFNDCDRVPDRNFLHAYRQAYARGSKGVMIGEIRELYISDPTERKRRVDAALADGRLARTPAYCKLVYRLFDQDGSTDSNVPWIATFSGNMAVTQADFERTGLFDPDFIGWGFEHFEWGYRAWKQGVSFIYNNAAINYHLAHSRADGFYRRSMEQSFRVLLRKHPDPIMERFVQFMNGTCSMQQLERASPGRAASWLSAADNEEPLFVQIV